MFRVFFILLFGLLALSCASTPEKEEPRKPLQQEFLPLVEIPSWGSYQNLSAIHSADDVAELFDVFVAEWEERNFPGSTERMKYFFSRIELHWQPTEFRSESFPDKPSLWGLTHIRRIGQEPEITVYVYDWRDKRPALGKTSLAHELIHIALYATTGDIQKDHHDSKKSKFSPELEKFKDDVNHLFR